MTNLYWLPGPWSGRLALAARPRGWDWLEDEASHWRRAGIGTVVSLLTEEEETELGLSQEAQIMESHGIQFHSFPIPDRDVPSSGSALAAMLERVDLELTGGGNVLVHCRQGIGRTGLVTACLLVTKGMDPATAVRRISEVRNLPVPETEAQRRWIDRYAASVPSVR